MNLFGKSYVTEAEADGYLGETTPWEDAESADKQGALGWATVYIDNHYDVRHVVLGQEDTTLKVCTALLANEQLNGDLFLREKQSKTERGLIEKTVIATPVESTKKYDAKVAKAWQDPFPDITAAMVAGGYTPLKSSGMRSVSMVRS